MSMSNTLSHLIEFNFESTADWRRGKAEEFPDDSRNLEAAEELDRLAKELQELAGSDLDRRIEALDAVVEKNGWDGDLHVDLFEWVSEELRGIGFRTYYENGAKFLDAYGEKFEKLIQEKIDQINSDDDDIPSPSLAEQVENDETVKAAKRAYDEARARAYAEARKRL
jgi:hypothetical protein